MPSITQTIPNYVSGISEQPDELKTPGQLTVAKNVLPDVTQGLLKRPGGKLIGGDLGAYTTDSKWFHYYRDETEQYIGQIKKLDGELKMWRCSDGQAMTVNYDSGTTTALKSYLTHTAEQDIQTLTLNDYTYIANRTKTVAMSSTVEPAQPPQAFIELKKVAYANQYAVNLFDNTTTTTVTTATRIEVSREVDSRSSCNSTGEFPSSGTLPGSTGYTDVCDNPASGGDSANDDDMRPNVATRIFSIDHGVSGDADDANGTAHTYTVTPNGGNASDI